MPELPEVETARRLIADEGLHRRIAGVDDSDFNGTDPWPTLAVFKELVARHEIHYYMGRGSQSFGGGRGSSAIESWAAARFTKVTVGGQTVYDLTQPTP
ncbi:MAG TPA: hypothetical protein VFQ68_24735 [Streptosporangiaceae bacterium]|nr:hypothetical protein [Streptosporangiaceae bacterium]